MITFVNMCVNPKIYVIDSTSSSIIMSSSFIIISRLVLGFDVKENLISGNLFLNGLHKNIDPNTTIYIFKSVSLNNHSGYKDCS